MKQEKDILDIFENSFESGTPINGGDWQNISMKNASKQFWKWNPLNINAYYAGLILVSFVGTFVLGTDYYITKHEVINTYKTRISTLESRLNELVINENKRIRKTSEQTIENDFETVDKPEDLSNNANAYQGLSQPSSNARKELDEPNQVDHKPINKIENVTFRSEEKEPLHVEHINPVAEPNGFIDSTINAEVKSVIDSKGSDTDQVKKTEPEKNTEVAVKETPSEPVIKYVQDTIYQIDSSKVSRWKMKKMK